MKTLVIILLIAAAVAYFELAIFTGTFMYLVTTDEAEKENRKELIAYSVIAGILFPITFAILCAYKKAQEGGEKK